MSQLSMQKLDELEKHFTKEIDDEEERENLYNQQAEEIAIGISNKKKVNDGYYTWALATRKNGNLVVVAARNMMMFQKGYTPMMGEFKPNKELPLIDNVHEVVKVMLKRQNGEYVAEEINE